MSISTEITRLAGAKSSIAQAISNKGVTVPAATKLDGYAALIDTIPDVNDNEIMTTQILTDEASATIYNRYFTSADVWLANSGSRSFFVDCLPNTRYIITTKNPNITIFRIASIPYNTSDTLPTRPTAAKILRLISCGAVGFTTDPTAKGLVVQIDAAIVDTKNTGISIFGPA